MIKNYKHSIKKRLVGSFMLIVLISIIILEVLLISFVKHYYYNNLQELLTNQIKISSDFYSRYFSNTSLEDNVLDNVDVFWKQTPTQVQIIDTSGNILMDSIGVISKGKVSSSDFKKAVKGEKGEWVGKVNYDTYHVMAASYPLKSDGKIVGVLRFTTSLRKVDRSILRISYVFLAIGCIVMGISVFISIFLADSITEPIKEVTHVAEKMASGDLKVRSHVRSDDEVGKLSDTLNYMAEEILKKEQLKDEFVASVSHELRTPLTSIKGWAITLNTENLDDKQLIRDGLQIIEDESERLTSMVEELLDFSKFVSGKVTLRKEKINIKNVIYYIETYMKPIAKRECIDFFVKCEENIPDIAIDENRIKQVLINVLDNSFKFTPKGGKVTFSTKLDGGYVTMNIKDTGCGISSDELPKVKEKFYKGKNSKSKNGIGLSICDEIIKMHDGIFVIESQLNKGTDILIRLPL